ncbi:MAG: helix-turn-helix domain-containing protein [Pirellula sp.]
MNEPDRSVAKRQIARLLGSSPWPVYVLSEDDVLVYANEAFATMVGQSLEELLGIHCQPSQDVAETNAELAMFLSLPVNWSRKYVKIVPMAATGLPESRFSPSSMDLTPGTVWGRCLIPVESSDSGCTLCMVCPVPDDSLVHPLDHHSAWIQSVLASTRASYPALRDLWFLHGKSSLVHRALQQAQLAIASDGPLSILGVRGSGRAMVAQCIHAMRSKRLAATNPDEHQIWIRMDCALMDSELIRSMLEMIHESTAKSQHAVTLLVDALEALPEECIGPLDEFLSKRGAPSYIVTCVSPYELGERALRAQSNNILLKSSTLRVELPRLSERLEDIRALIAAWFSFQTKHAELRREYNDAFVDALTAYPWPDDIDEFSEALRFATERTSKDSTMSIEHLPVVIRTYASHVEHVAKDESIDLDAVLADIEKTLILRALEKHSNNKSAASKILNISRARLIRKLRQLGLQSEDDVDQDDDDRPDFNEVT